MKMQYRILIFLFMLSGCADKYKMIPVLQTGGNQKFEGAAIGGLSGLSILVEVGEWNGKADVLEKITPVKITVYNKTGLLLKIQYSNFSFRGKKSNFHYAAMPPYEIRGTVKDPTIVLPYPFPVQSTIDYNDKFQVASYCARMYPEFFAYPEPFFVDINYYNRYYYRWAKIDLPTVTMLSKLVPDGVLGNNGYVSGYLYFEKITATDEELEFCAVLIDANGDKPVGSIRIPFCFVKRK